MAVITLGINAAFHDTAAALLADGVPLAAAEEERFTRIKHGKRPVPFSAWELPYHAIDYCLGQAGLTLADVDHVAYSFDPWQFVSGRIRLDAAKRQLDLLVEPATLEQRKAERQSQPKARRGYALLYEQAIQQANLGADFDFLRHVELQSEPRKT